MHSGAIGEVGVLSGGDRHGLRSLPVGGVNVIDSPVVTVMLVSPAVATLFTVTLPTGCTWSRT